MNRTENCLGRRAAEEKRPYVSRCESLLTAFAQAQGVIKIDDKSPQKTLLAAHGDTTRALASEISARLVSRGCSKRKERLYNSRPRARSLGQQLFYIRLKPDPIVQVGHFKAFGSRCQSRPRPHTFAIQSRRQSCFSGGQVEKADSKRIALSTVPPNTRACFTGDRRYRSELSKSDPDDELRAREDRRARSCRSGERV
eukprot:6214514-Pleurochrysis_carterae.AAC.7